MTPFHHLVANNLVANVTNFTVWFALTFWTFLETRSVFATGMIAGGYLVLTAGLGFWFGSLVDHHRKKIAMLGSSIASFVLYAAGLGILYLNPEESFRNPYGAPLWMLAAIVLIGVIAGNVRTIALPTLVTLLVPEDRRDKANGLVGIATGVGFLTTSAISGYLVARGGMQATLMLGLGLTVLAMLHLGAIRIDEPKAELEPGETAQPKRVDIRGTVRIVRGVPGLLALILFTCFNNFLGGIFMALLDAYGLSLVSVEAWGLLFAVLSVGFIASGVVISKTGLGKNPVKTLLTVNLLCWMVCCVFTLKSSIVLVGLGCFVWFLLTPFAEASEHTTLQKVVPYERQGRVFGFAQSVEQSASPLTAFMIGPLTQFFFIPFMVDGAGADAIGDWFGRGPERGIALVFTLAGIVGVIVTVLAFNSPFYRRLSAEYAKGKAEEGEATLHKCPLAPAKTGPRS